jgi:hypothetical protein
MRYALALLAGVLVLAILVPASGAGFRCYSFFAFEVPCEGWLAIVGGAATAGLVASALWLGGRRGP